MLPDAQAIASAQTLLDQEVRAFGVNHAEVGARLMERWSFSPDMVACVPFPSSTRCRRRIRPPWPPCVNLGDSIAYGLQQERAGQALTWADPAAALAILHFTEADLPRYMERIKENLEFVEAMCRLPG